MPVRSYKKAFLKKFNIPMKHKNANNWREMDDRFCFINGWFPRFKCSVSNGLRRLRIKTWRQYDVPCTVRKQIWSFFQVPAPIWNHHKSPRNEKKTWVVLDDRNEASRTTGKEPVAKITKSEQYSDCGSKRSLQHNISKKKIKKGGGGEERHRKWPAVSGYPVFSKG